MAKKKPNDAPATNDAGGEPRAADPAATPATVAPGQSPTSQAIRVIQAVCGVGCVQAKRYLLRMQAEEQAAIVARFAQPEAHDAIRQIVLDAQQPKEAPADEPSGDANDA